MRKRSAGSGRGARRFVRGLVGRVRRAGATGKLTIRADSGFWSHKVMDACVDHDVDFSITVARQKPIVAAIDAIDDDAWVDIAYTKGGIAQVAQTKLGKSRLIVRRTKIVDDPALPTLFADWRHHAFVTNRTGDAVTLDADHRAHAVVELAIRDLTDVGCLPSRDASPDPRVAGRFTCRPRWPWRGEFHRHQAMPRHHAEARNSSSSGPTVART